MVNTVQDMNFGGFAVEAGSATITMNSTGGLTTAGLVSPSTTIPATTWIVNVDNTLASACATHGFSIELRKAPRPLSGPGGNIPLDNIRVTIPAYGLNDVTLPQVIAPGPGNTAPFTMTIYGEITVTSPQTAGQYSSALDLLLFQTNRRYRAVTTVLATSIVPLSIAEIAPMNFGTIAGGPIPGTVILNTGNGRIATGDAQLIASGPGNAATFQLTGAPNNTYSLSYSNGILANCRWSADECHLVYGQQCGYDSGIGHRIISGGRDTECRHKPAGRGLFDIDRRRHPLHRHYQLQLNYSSPHRGYLPVSGNVCKPRC